MKLKNIAGISLLFLSTFAALCLLTACSSPSAQTEPIAEVVTVPELIKRADGLYAGREDLTSVRGGLSFLRRARTMDPGNYEALWRIAKFDYYLGAHTTDDDERDKAFREGVDAGETAVKVEDGKPEGHFWLGANLGGRAQHSALSGLADAEDIRKQMQAVIKLDEGFQGGSAYMVLGQVNLELPKILGGDKQEAVRNLEKGLTFGEDNALLRLRLAEAYFVVKRPADARKQIDILMNQKPNPDYLPEYKEAIAEAKKLLEKNAQG